MKRLLLCMTLCVLPAFCQSQDGDQYIGPNAKPYPQDQPKSMEDLTKNGFFAVIDDTEAVFFPCTDKDSGKQKICTDKVPSMRMRIALLEDQIDKLEARIKALEEAGHVNRSSLQ